MSRPLQPDDHASVIISIRLTREDLARIDRQAWSRRITRSEYLRRLIHETKKPDEG